MTVMIKLTINNKRAEFNGDETMPLLWYLRDHRALTGTKFGCGIGACGACSVHVDGVLMRSCSVPMAALNNKKIQTIEGLKEGGNLHPVQQAWVDFAVPQCGYCQAGQIMAVTDFLKRFPNPTDADIDANLKNICRCGTYTRMRKAIHQAAKALRDREVVA